MAINLEEINGTIISKCIQSYDLVSIETAQHFLEGMVNKIKYELQKQFGNFNSSQQSLRDIHYITHLESTPVSNTDWRPTLKELIQGRESILALLSIIVQYID